jgi:hypothetical protein
MKTIKCRAGDFDFDVNGKTRYIIDEEKLAQDLAVFILAENLEGITTEAEANAVVSSAINKLNIAQNNAYVTSDREKILEIVELTTVQSDNLTDYYFFVRVRTNAGDIINKLFDKNTWTDLSHLLPDKLPDNL